MNTIPTISNPCLPSYTAVGGKVRQADTGLSAVVLNRPGPHSRHWYFQELKEAGFDYVLSIENTHHHYDMEELSKRFPFARFILPHQPLSFGEQINLAAAELASPLFFVLWNDVKITASCNVKQVIEQIKIEQNDSKEDASPYRRLCTVPLILNPRFEAIPTLVMPTVSKRKIGTMLFSPYNEGLPSLYPYDGIGIYDKDRFVKMGGFDGTLKNAYWQLIDFGFRSYLWGEDISVNQQINIMYDKDPPLEDQTIDESFCRFYFKNLAPVLKRDAAFLPLNAFFTYLFSSRSELFHSWEEFAKCKRWVKENAFRWKGDAQTVIERWDGILGNGES